ncbi:hypothetical protein [Streptomyces anulatus]|uniref:hypothetical protein n=1 Tax=Streptomyces anulatus TaxID=1892 RepID=UPI001C269AB4|nr:hypothetical protein [Streptomyces anulatus]
MTNAAKRHPLIPVVPPEVLHGFYTPQEIVTLFGVVREHGPWRLVLAHHFASAEEYLATSGGRDRKQDARLSDFTAPVFRGYFAREAAVIHDEVRDLYFSRKLLEPVLRLHNARYGMPLNLLFNLGGPSHSFDAGHFDSSTWRGMTVVNTPVWLLSVMSKSGLFDAWEVKSGQVITYFCPSDVGGGFTYWPDGPDLPPQRFAAPFDNTAILSDNSHMYHRREANGPHERRDATELTMTSSLSSHGDDAWVVRDGDREIERFSHRESRSLFHYTALAFDDLADMTRYLDHTDDLTSDKVFEILVADLKTRGIRFSEPSDPMADREFVALLTDTYAMAPRNYPAEAPLDVHAARP